MICRMISLLIFVLSIFVPFTVFASFVKLTQTSATTFSVDFDNFSNVGGVLVSIKYDPDTAAVTGARHGAGVPSQTQYITGTPAPGELRIVMAGLVPFPKSGNLATVTFSPKSGSDVAIREVSAKLSTTDAKPLPNAAVQVYKSSFTNPPVDNTGSGSGGNGTGGAGSGNTGGGSTNTGTGSNGGGSTNTGTGTLDPVQGVSGGSGGSWRSASYVETLKNTETQAVASQPQSAASTVASNVTVAGGAVAGTITPPETRDTKQSDTPEAVQAARQTVGVDRPEESADSKDKKALSKKDEPASVKYDKIALRFKNLSEKPVADELINLFAEPAEPLITQSPEIAYLSDKDIKLQISTKLLLTNEPSFIVKGASLTDIKLTSGKWSLAVTPKPKFSEITLVIMDGGERTIEYSLVVVPKIKLSVDPKKKTDKSAFTALLKDRNSEKAVYDFNGDNKHDYLDDYIYTANFIRETGVKPLSVKKRISKENNKGESASFKDTGKDQNNVKPAPAPAPSIKSKREKSN